MLQSLRIVMPVSYTHLVEKDEVQIMSGLLDGVTTGAPLCAMIENSDQHSKDYSLLKECMRPGHSDYPAYVKYHGYNLSLIHI